MLTIKYGRSLRAAAFAPSRGLYMNDPRLDKSKYKPDETEYAKQYINNYLTEEEI